MAPTPPCDPNVQPTTRAREVKWQRMYQRPGKNSVVPMSRHGHRAVVYRHLMIIFSGANERFFQDVSVYSTVTNRWMQPIVTGDIPPGRACYGIVIDDLRILIFGGMEEYCKFTDALYELNLKMWEWKLLKPESRAPSERPCAKMGHSFTLIKDKVFMFGGLANNNSEHDITHELNPLYLNDMHLLHVRLNEQHGVWELPVTYGNAPCPRESHSAVHFKDNGRNKLVIFGGMNGINRLGDLYTLDDDTMLWSQIEYDAASSHPSARSLHTASVVGNRMYIFGGWTQMMSIEELQASGDPFSYDKLWKCDNNLFCLNLKTMAWEKIVGVGSTNRELPECRAGHSACVINNKIYFLYGRNGYKKVNGPNEELKQDCFNDMWKLEVQKPAVPNKVKLLKIFVDRFSVGWNPVPGADGYILQCMKIDMPASATVGGTTEPSMSPAGHATTQSGGAAMSAAHSVQTFPPHQGYSQFSATGQHIAVRGGFNMLALPPSTQQSINGYGSVPHNHSASMPRPILNGHQTHTTNNINSGVQLQPNMMPQQVAPNGNSLQLQQQQPQASLFRTIRMPANRGFIAPNNANGMHLRPPCPPNMTRQVSPTFTQPQPLSSSTQSVSVLSSEIAPQFKFQSMTTQQHPLSRSGVENVGDLMKRFASQRQLLQATSPAFVATPPATTSAGHGHLSSQATQQTSEYSDSTLRPPPPSPGRIAPTSTTSTSSYTQKNLQGTSPHLAPNQGIQTSNGTVYQELLTSQKRRYLVRITKKSPTVSQQQATQQRFCLTGSHVTSPAPPQSQPDTRQPSIVLTMSTRTQQVEQRSAPLLQM